jgi:CBS domain containing-hemolysin-like protein
LGIAAEPATSALFREAFAAVGLAGVGGPGHTALSVLVAVIVLILLHVILAEQAPTYLGIERTKTVCRYGAEPLYWWTKLTWPVIRAADRVAKAVLGVFGVEITRSWTQTEAGESAPATRGELRRQMGQALSGAGASGERRREVLRALEIGDLVVREIAIPPDRVVALDLEDGLEANLDRMRSSGYVRFPLVEGRLGELRGIVYAPAVLRHLQAIREGRETLSLIAADPMRVEGDAVVAELIDRFQAEHQEMALIVDGDDVVGLVTATDAVEAIIGELEDPLDHDTDPDA